mgnify:CR=1 FL=1
MPIFWTKVWSMSISNKNGNIIQKFLDMVKGETDSKNEKVKSYSKTFMT